MPMSARNPATVLLIDDDEDVLTSLSLYLKLHFKQVLTSNTPGRINELISQNEIDIVLLDMNFRKGTNDGKEGLYWLDHIKELRPDTSVLLITAYGSIELAVEALKRGASDFVVKPWNNQKLLQSLLRALELKRSKHKHQPERKPKKTRDLQEEQLHSRSPQMQQVITVAEKVAATEANVLITGENGTGKEVMAAYIHRHSQRADKPLVTLDLGSVNENLFEAELFGYKKGAFTDAKEDKPGRFEMAQGGTLFLDEIGNIPMALQAKLLTAIQNKLISPVGSTTTLKVDCRIICATNANLQQEVASGSFRQDLLFRINTIELKLPPLRERKEDIPGLAQHFLNRFNDRYERGVSLEKKAMDALKEYAWPGNIRELQHVIERSVILAESGSISNDDLQLTEQPATNFSDDDDLDLEELEKRHISRVLQKFEGNISHAARALKINRNTLYRKIEKYGL